MIDLFATIIRLEQMQEVRDVLIFSLRGKMMYAMQPFSAHVAQQRIDLFGKALDTLGDAAYSELYFQDGFCLLRRVSLGYILLVLKNSDTPESAVSAVDTFCGTMTSEDSGQVLLQLLFRTRDVLKPFVLEELERRGVNGALCEELLPFLEKYQNISRNVRDHLLGRICRIFGRNGGEKEKRILEGFIKEAEAQGVLSEAVLAEASAAVKRLSSSREASQSRLGKARLVSPYERSSSAEQGDDAATSGDEARAFEEQADAMVAEGRIESADYLLLEKIERFVKELNFPAAQRLRQKLISIDPANLQEIIKAAELIDTAKVARVPDEDLNLWSSMIDVIGLNEFADMYILAEPMVFEYNETVIHQGTYFPALILVRQGSLQGFATVYGRQRPLRTFEAGDVAGLDTFFDPTVWTMGLRSLGAEALVLQKGVFLPLLELYPTLEGSLQKLKNTTMSSFLMNTNRKSRRSSERLRFERQIMFSILDKDGRESDVAGKADLLDISLGGVTMIFPFYQREKAQEMMGKTCRLKIPYLDEGKKKHYEYLGEVVTVRDLLRQGYQLHVKFEKRLSRLFLDELIHSDAASW